MSTKLFIIDDDDSLSELMKNVLEMKDYHVLTYKTGEKALKELEQEQPGLIILDNLLLGQRGSDICHQIKSTPSTSKIPIIMTTGQTVIEEMDDEEAELLKPDDYLIKPFEIEDLLQKVSYWGTRT